MRTAKAFPSPFPAGCCTRDFTEDWLALRDVTTDVNRAWAQFIGVTERYLCDLSGLDIGMYGGRGHGPELGWARACPPSAPRIPKVSRPAMWLKGVALAAADGVSADPIRRAR
eukprot:9180238-Pyramimonas_sp.AAC.1